MRQVQMKKRYIKAAAAAGLLVILAGGFCWQISEARNGETPLWGMADVREVGVNPKVSGRIVELYVKEGDMVKKGQILARIDQDAQKTERTQAEAAIRAQYAQIQQAVINSNTDSGTLDAALLLAKAKQDQAATALSLAQKDEARYSALLAQGAVSQQQYDTIHANMENARSAYDAAGAAVASARVSLDRKAANAEAEEAQREQLEALRGKLDAVALSENETVIRAPFDGVITKKYLEEGALVSPSVPIFSLQDSRDNWVDFKVKETDLGKYHVGDEVLLTGRNDNVKISGKIESISRKADYATVKATNERGDADIITFNVKVRTDSVDVWPGMRWRLTGDGK